MIQRLINNILYLLFHMTEIKHHTLLIELSGQYDIYYPAFTEQTAAIIKIGEVDDAEIIYEKLGHVGPCALKYASEKRVYQKMWSLLYYYFGSKAWVLHQSLT